MQRTFAGLRFPVPVAVREGVLGGLFSLRIGDRSAKLYTPGTPREDDEWHQLDSPDVPGADRILRLTGAGGWGYVYERGPGHYLKAVMDAVVVEFADLDRDDAGRLRPQLQAWLALFADWVEALSRQSLELSSADEPYPLTADFWLGVDVTGEMTVFDPREAVTATFIAPGPAIDRDAWEDALALANNARPLPLAHQLLNDARAGFRGGHRRKAVLDAATAVEVAVGERLLGELEHRLGRADATRLLKRIRQIFTQVELLPLFGVGLPKTLTPDLLTPRNKVAHEGHLPTDDQARRALRLAEHVINKLGSRLADAES